MEILITVLHVTQLIIVLNNFIIISENADAKKDTTMIIKIIFAKNAQIFGNIY